MELINHQFKCCLDISLGEHDAINAHFWFLYLAVPAVIINLDATCVRSCIVSFAPTQDPVRFLAFFVRPRR